MLQKAPYYFAGSGGTFAQDNANFFWDDVNNRLGIGTARSDYEASRNRWYRTDASSVIFPGYMNLSLNGSGSSADYNFTSSISDKTFTSTDLVVSILTSE